MSPPFIANIFSSSRPTHSYNLRNNNLINNHCRTSNFGLKSFTHTSITIWNSLPNNIKTCTDFKIFKKLISSWSGPTCKCSSCRQ
jgi:hypothetical protein